MYSYCSLRIGKALPRSLLSPPSIFPPAPKNKEQQEAAATAVLLLSCVKRRRSVSAVQQTHTRKMQPLRKRMVEQLRFSVCGGGVRPPLPLLLYGSPRRQMCASSSNQDNIKARVIDLVKKLDTIEANKVTETADFQKDLSLDSLDRVELVMALEQEFSIEIPDDKADKLFCCDDVAKYITSEAQSNANAAEGT